MRLVRVFGYATEKIAGNLKRNGWTNIVPPEGFFVKDKKDSLKNGELKRAVCWAKEIVKSSPKKK